MDHFIRHWGIDAIIWHNSLKDISIHLQIMHMLNMVSMSGRVNEWLTILCVCVYVCVCLFLLESQGEYSRVWWTVVCFGEGRHLDFTLFPFFFASWFSCYPSAVVIRDWDKRSRHGQRLGSWDWEKSTLWGCDRPAGACYDRARLYYDACIRKNSQTRSLYPATVTSAPSPFSPFFLFLFFFVYLVNYSLPCQISPACAFTETVCLWYIDLSYIILMWGAWTVIGGREWGLVCWERKRERASFDINEWVSSVFFSPPSLSVLMSVWLQKIYINIL